MATCGGRCTQACSCSFSEDGFHANLASPVNGRNFTLLDGNGTPQDPFTISFFDQEDFRPRTAEIQYQNITVNTGVPTNATNGSAVYESPIRFLVSANKAALHYYYIGASVTFAETADASSNRKHLRLSAEIEWPLPGSVVSTVIGGQTIPGGGSDPLTLTASAYLPGVLWNWEAAFGGFDGNVYNQAFNLAVYQNSGGPVAVSDLKIWITQI